MIRINMIYSYKKTLGVLTIVYFSFIKQEVKI